MTVKNIVKEILSYIVMIAMILLVFKVFSHFVAAPFVVDGQSMYDTLEDGEKLWMIRYRDIERFDVVVFHPPNNPDSLYVKRIVGVPGDSLAMENDQLILNGQAMAEPYLEPVASASPGPFNRDFSLESTAGVSVIPEGYFYVIGDNRRNSVDSRDFGLIEADSIVGEADWIFWPLSEIGTLDQYSLSPDGSEIVLDSQ